MASEIEVLMGQIAFQKAGIEAGFGMTPAQIAWLAEAEAKVAFKSYSEAAAALPEGAKWSASFGNPGEGGYCEFHRVAGKRFAIENGSWSACAPFEWTLKEVLN